MPETRVGVDVGGTFTDVVSIVDGRLALTKAPSTPDAPEAGVVDGVERAAAADGPTPGAIDWLLHGTTVATNAVLERTWADAALVTDEGFRDVLEIGRQDRPALYDLHATKPEPVVPRDRRFEVAGRLDERGAVERDLDEAAVRTLADDLAAAREDGGGSGRGDGGGRSDDDGRDGGDGGGGDEVSGDRGSAGSRDGAAAATPAVDSVAVCRLFAYENDDHERRVADLLRERLDVPVTVSADVLPELREYERSLATALNAALLPVMDEYLGQLAERLAAAGCTAPLSVMTSGGGLVGAEHARERPVETLLSGPAAGVQGAAHVAGLAGVEDLLTMDVGGTSCDVSLVTGGEPVVTTERSVGGYDVAVPAVDVHTVGAGGGSIAWLDRGGALRVGPRSAGAEPGPVCYGRGGTEPTVTDAQLLLGRLDPDALLVEELAADVDAVERAVAEHVAEPMDASVEGAARGILEVAHADVEQALRVVSVERGHDPREFALVAYGGAGPLLATAVAERLEIPRVLVPRTAGALSALGLLATDRAQAVSRSMVRPLDGVAPAALADVLAELEATGRERLRAHGGEPERVVVERSLDLRYAGQSSELTVALPDDGTAAAGSDDAAPTDGVHVDQTTLGAAAHRFHERHEAHYGHAAPDEPVELVTVRVRVRAPVDPPPLRAADADAGTAADERGADAGADPGADADAHAETADGALRTHRPVAFDDDWRETRIYDRERLPAGASFDGPAVVEGPGSTLVVRPGQSASVDEHGTIAVEVAP